MTERKCPIEYGSSDTCNESVYRDCTYPKGLNGCARIESLRENIVENIEDYWLHLAEGAH